MVNKVLQIIKGTGTYTAGVSTFDVVISPALTNVNKSILLVSFSYAGTNDADGNYKSYEILDVNTIRFYGSNTAGDNLAVGFAYTIIEFTGASDLVVQKNALTIPAGAAEGEIISTAFTAVVLAQSSIIYSGFHYTSVDSTEGQEEIARVRLVSTTTWGWFALDTPSTTALARAQIIDWGAGVSCQRGLATLAANTGTITIVPGVAVTRNRCILRVTGQSTEAALSQEADATAISATINGAGSIVITRSDSSVVSSMLLAWEIIQFPASDRFLAQYGTLTLALGVTTNTVAITTIGSNANSIVTSTVDRPFGQGNGQCGSDTAGAFNEATSRLTIIGTTSVQGIRQASVDFYTVEFQVLEFARDLSKTFLVDAIVVNVRTKTFLVDSVLALMKTKTFLVDALILSLNSTETFNADAFLSSGPTIFSAVDAIVVNIFQETFLADAIVVFIINETFLVDAQLLGREIILVDAIIRGQLSVPINPDIVTDGWTPTPLWQNLDEEPHNPLEFITLTAVPFNPTNLFQVTMSPLIDPVFPASPGDHKIRATARTLSSNIAIQLKLFQAVTERASSPYLRVPALVFTTLEYILTQAEVDSITDYTDLRIRVIPALIGDPFKTFQVDGVLV